MTSTLKYNPKNTNLRLNSQTSTGQGENEETEQAVFKYGARVPQVSTQYSAVKHDGAVSFAGGQVMLMRGQA